MKSIAILFFMVVCANSVFAQIMARNDNKYHQLLTQPLNGRLYSEARPTGLRQRNIGRALTLGGVVLGFGGVIVFSDARKGRVINGGQITQSAEENKMTLGILMVEGGLGMFIPGVILWKKGQKKYNRYLEQQSVSLHTTGSGILFRYSL